MTHISSLRRRDFSQFLVVAVFTGLSFGTAITFASGLSPKWFISIAFLLVCLSMSPMIKEKERFVLYLSVLVLPISIDFYLIHLKSLPYSLPVSGLRVSAFNVLFYFLLISWTARTARTPGTEFHIYPWISVPFAIIWLICLLSSISSPLPGIIKVSYLWYALQNWLVFLYVSNNLKDRRVVFFVVSLFILSGVMESLLAMAQYATGGTLGLDLFGETEKGYFVMKVGSGTVNRVAGTLGHPNKLGMFLGMLIPLNLVLLLAPIQLRFKIMLIPSLVLMMMAVVLTFSRGAWLSLSLGSAITLYWCVAKRTGSKVLSGFLITSIIVVGVLSAVTMVEPVRKRLFQSDFGTGHVRIPLAKLALNMIRENPLLGVGPGAFTAVSHSYDNTREGISYSFPAPVHNEFLLTAAELGLPALGLLLIMVGYIFINILKSARSRGDPVISYLGIGLFGAWTSWMIHLMVDYESMFISSPVLWFNLGLLVAVARIASKQRASHAADPPNAEHGLSPSGLA